MALRTRKSAAGKAKNKNSKITVLEIPAIVQRQLDVMYRNRTPVYPAWHDAAIVKYYNVGDNHQLAATLGRPWASVRRAVRRLRDMGFEIKSASNCVYRKPISDIKL